MKSYQMRQCRSKQRNIGTLSSRERKTFMSRESNTSGSRGRNSPFLREYKARILSEKAICSSNSSDMQPRARTSKRVTTLWIVLSFRAHKVANFGTG